MPGARRRGLTLTDSERERCEGLASRLKVSDKVVARRALEIGLAELERQVDGGTLGGVLDLVADGVEVIGKLREAGEHLFGGRQAPGVRHQPGADLTGIVVRRKR